MPSNKTPLSTSLLALAKLIEQSAHLGAGVLESLGGSYPQILQSLGKLISAEIPLSSCDSCEIPPPCWMPRQLCEVTSLGRPGDKASLCFVITNCSMSTRMVTVFTSTTASGLTFSPTGLDLGPMERGEIVVTYTIPTGSSVGKRMELLMWVRGCRLYFLRWTVVVGAIGANTCYEVDVKDCPDPIHHWYDHFYCPRPCLEDRGITRG
jgi:hypothetical protein